MLEARQHHASGKIDAEALREVEDRTIADAVHKRESVGTSDVTDSEFRRAYFHLDFLKQLDGVSVIGAIAANKSARVSDDGLRNYQ